MEDEEHDKINIADCGLEVNKGTVHIISKSSHSIQSLKVHTNYFSKASALWVKSRKLESK